MRKFFLDTGYLIALEAADDQYHQTALVHWENLTKSIPPLVTTSYVFDEVVTFFNMKRRNAKAVEIGKLILASPSVELIHIDEKLFHEAWRYFIHFKFLHYVGADPRVCPFRGRRSRKEEVELYESA